MDAYHFKANTVAQTVLTPISGHGGKINYRDGQVVNGQKLFMTQQGTVFVGREKNDSEQQYRGKLVFPIYLCDKAQVDGPNKRITISHIVTMQDSKAVVQETSPYSITVKKVPGTTYLTLNREIYFKTRSGEKYARIVPPENMEMNTTADHNMFEAVQEGIYQEKIEKILLNKWHELRITYRVPEAMAKWVNCAATLPLQMSIISGGLVDETKIINTVLRAHRAAYQQLETQKAF